MIKNLYDRTNPNKPLTVREFAKFVANEVIDGRESNQFRKLSRELATVTKLYKLTAKDILEIIETVSKEQEKAIDKYLSND